MPHRFPRRSVAVAAAVAAALTFSTPATAASRKPKPQRFTAQGLVVASTSRTLRVLTRHLKVGAASLPANTVVTVKRPSGKSRTSTASLVGYTVTISGSAATSGKILTFAASTEVAQPRPAAVFLGVVAGLTSSGLMLEESSAAGGGHFGHDRNTLTVDTSGATVSVDGAAGTVGEDEFVIVLGERDGDNVVAATVDAYTTPPDVEAGRISDITGSTVTLGDEWGGDPSPSAGPDPSATQPGDGSLPDDDDDSQPGDDTPPLDEQPATVDLTNVPVVLNGRSTVDVATLTAGERIVVLGETDATTGAFSPQIAFAFNRHDRRPATHRHHHQD